MPINRRETLEAFLREHPGDAFASYGLAMELKNAGDNAAALLQLQRLHELHPGYVAAYHQAGQLLLALERVAEARALLEQGIAVASRSGDQHAQSEMQGLLDEIEMTR